LALKNQHLNESILFKNNTQIISFFSVLKHYMKILVPYFDSTKAIMKTNFITIQQKFQLKLVKSPNLEKDLQKHCASIKNSNWDKLRAGAFVEGL